jgi:hypothetical protein
MGKESMDVSWSVQEKTRKMSGHSEAYLAVFTVYSIATGFGFL